jgi:hypothetical protein
MNKTKKIKYKAEFVKKIGIDFDRDFYYYVNERGSLIKTKKVIAHGRYRPKLVCKKIIKMKEDSVYFLDKIGNLYRLSLSKDKTLATIVPNN